MLKNWRSSKKSSSTSFIKMQNSRVFQDFPRQFWKSRTLQDWWQPCKALANLGPETQVTLHFDTTGRSRVDGECQAINFLNAYEDRESSISFIDYPLLCLESWVGGGGGGIISLMELEPH